MADRGSQHLRGSTQRRLASSWQAGEGDPEAPEQTETQDDKYTTAELVHYQSIYSFIVLYPEIHRTQTGHYYSSKVCMAFTYMLIVVSIQVFITFKSGKQILEESASFTRSLVVKETPGPWDWMDIKTSDDVMSEYDKQFTQIRKDLLKKGTNGKAKCCIGADCAASGMACCTPQEVHGLTGNNATAADKGISFIKQDLLKPSSGKKSGQQEAGSVGATASGALCLDADGMLDCAQPSFAYTEAWDKLDANQDGVWTRAEAVADPYNLGCTLEVSALEVFRSVVRGIVSDTVMDNDADTEITTAAKKDIRAEKAKLNQRGVTKRDFTDWAALSAICSVTDESRCGSLMAMGVFDGAMQKDGGADKVTNLDRAMEYCTALLSQGGTCDKMLPVTFQMYRHRSSDKCGEKSYSIGPHVTNPYNDNDQMRTLMVHYSAVSNYELADSWNYIIFLGLILMVWYVNLLGELYNLVALLDFTIHFPTTWEDPFKVRAIWAELQGAVSNMRLPNFEKVLGEESEPLHSHDKVGFSSISIPHRITCVVIVFVRLTLVVWMFFAGTVFCTSTFSFAALLVDAVSLAFVFELPVFFYVFLIPGPMKKVLEENMDPLLHKTRRWPWLLESIFSKSAAGLVILPLVVVLVSWHHQFFTVQPALEALNCVCFQKGPRCMASDQMSREWWDTYWQAQK
eukprot:gb/GFBE01059500.1/.p1 GENE.gb/GFBE01059500.1/~~gb/GFBE01059500.1/.p1  ORF type:complete len:684 (+),score=152.14 gb/GFBE01059500.1/:1-2052(+)